MAGKQLIHTEPVAMDRIDVTSFGEYYISANADLLAKILAQDYGCKIVIEVYAVDCPDKPTGQTYADRVNIDHGCKGLIGSTTGTGTITKTEGR